MIATTAKKGQNSKRIGAAVGLILLTIGFLSFSQRNPLVGTISAVVPPGLEVRMADEGLALNFEFGTLAVAATELSVGTNDWPLEVYAEVFPVEERSALVFDYRLEIAQESSPKSPWIRLLNSKPSPPIQLFSPGWTTYTLSIRVSAQEALPGTFFRNLRLIFCSQAGLVETIVIDVSATLFQLAAMDTTVGVDGPSNNYQGDVFGSDLREIGSDTALPMGESVVIVTWEGVTQASWKTIPAGS